MLQKLRSGSRTWVGVVIAGFLMIMFGFTAMNEFGGSGTSPTGTVITVGSGEIDGREYQSEYRRVVNRISTEQKRRITYEDAKKEGLVKQVNDNLITFARARLELDALGVQVPMESVARLLNLSEVAYPIRSQADPRYLFAQMVQGGMNRGAALARLQTMIAQSQLREAVGLVGAVPKSIADRLYKLRNERRVADVIQVPITAIKSVPDPTDAQLAAYHKANAAKYRVPRLRAITAIIVRPKDADIEIKITGDMIRKAYEARKTEFSDPEKREVHQIVVKDEATAKKTLAAIQKGKNFDEAAKEIAKSSVRSLGLLSPVQIAGLPVAAMRTRIPKLEKGQIAGPFKSPFGWHLIIVVDIVTPKIKPLSQVRQQIVDDIRRRERPKVLARWRDRIDDDITAGDRLESIAKSLKIKVRKIPALSRDGKNAEGGEVKDLPTPRRFLRAAFDQKPGVAGDIYDTQGDGGFYILRVDKETPPRITPLKDIRKRVISDWTDDQREKLARALAEKVAASMREGRSAEGAAKQFGLTSRTTPPLVRGGSEATGAAETSIQNAVFAAKQGAVVIGKLRAGWAVAKVTKIMAPDEKQAKAERKKINDAVEQSIGIALLTAFQQSLVAKYPAEVDQPAIDALFQRQRSGG